MKFLVRLVFFVSSAFILASCGGSAPADNEGGWGSIGIAGNNLAILDGATIGSGEAINAELRKTVEITQHEPNANFELGTASLTRTSLSDESVYLVLPVTNVGSDARCFVKFEEITYMGGGLTLATDDYRYADGSVALLSGDIYTNTCLDPGQSGYFLDYIYVDSGSFYSLVDSIEIGAVVAIDSEPRNHPLELIPTSYSVSGTNDLSVTMQNQGTETVVTSLETFSTYVLLDGNDMPLGWWYFDRANESLAPGENGIFSDSVLFDGSASRVRVFADFDAVTSATAALSASQFTQMSAEERLELRDWIEAEKERAARR